ncbi:MAG: type II toxin-antitoxin system Phd/YefM family antitoxin [Desulfuromonadales bacterium]|nr:type II toxin-antitoxin system Phd/YefM family antitoxin [Desulfuromonadales bacterium]
MSKSPKIIPISDLRQNASGAIKSVTASHEPLFITQRGRATAVMVSMSDYEHTQHELEIPGSSGDSLFNSIQLNEYTV